MLEIREVTVEAVPFWVRPEKRPNLSVGPHKRDRVGGTMVTNGITVARPTTLYHGGSERVVHERDGASLVLEFVRNFRKFGLVDLPMV
jgi:hypothetical protein